MALMFTQPTSCDPNGFGHAYLRPASQRASGRPNLGHLDVAANGADIAISDCSGADVVTTLSQLGCRN